MSKKFEIKEASDPIGCVEKLCLYYKQALYMEKIDRETGEITIDVNMPNLIVAESLRWIEQNITKFEKFYRAVIETFVPTMTTPYPTIKHLQDVYDRFKSPIQYKPDYDMKELDNLKVDDAEPEVKNANIEQVLKDNKFLTAPMLIHKYGKKSCCEAWLEAGKRMTDKEYEDYTFSVRHR